MSAVRPYSQRPIARRFGPVVLLAALAIGLAVAVAWSQQRVAESSRSAVRVTSSEVTESPESPAPASTPRVIVNGKSVPVSSNGSVKLETPHSQTRIEQVNGRTTVTTTDSAISSGGSRNNDQADQVNVTISNSGNGSGRGRGSVHSYSHSFSSNSLGSSYSTSQVFGVGSNHYESKTSQ
jgi:hypothetical protein